MSLSRSALLLALAAITAPAQAGSIVLPEGTLSTSYQDPAGTSAVNESFSASFDLSNIGGLTPGDPIEVAFTYSAALTWLGTIDSGQDPITLNWAATFGLQVGARSASITETLSLGPGPIPGGGGAFAVLSGPTPLSLIVPWGTDLSNVTLSLTDQSSISGVGGRFVDSRLTSTDAVLSTSSVPEPSGTVLALIAGATWAHRRARARA